MLKRQKLPAWADSRLGSRPPHSWIELRDGSLVVAEASRLRRIAPTGGGDEDAGRDTALAPRADEWAYAWCAFARILWSDEERVLTLTFIDPAIADIVLVPASEPSLRFMTAVRERLDAAHVFRASTKLAAGNRATVWVLRDSRGELFTVTTATGTPAAADEDAIHALEQRAQLHCGLA